MNVVALAVLAPLASVPAVKDVVEGSLTFPSSTGRLDVLWRELVLRKNLFLNEVFEGSLAFPSSTGRVELDVRWRELVLGKNLRLNLVEG